MSIAVLGQVSDELRRLAIAGSAVAPGDFRLKNLAGPLRQAGAKAPVFAKVADAVEAVVGSDERTSAAALLDASTLVGAVLYTQGTTGIAGEFQPLATADLSLANPGLTKTETPARVLKPLLEALTSAGPGRLELIRDAHERGLFDDLRLMLPAVAAIDDSYPDVAEFVVKHVLPRYGAAIAPALRSAYDSKGKLAHARRLKLLHALDPAGTRELVLKALEESSAEVRVAATECLGDTPADLQLLLDQSRSKAKAVRQAAYLGLARGDAPEAIERLKEAMAGPDRDLARDAVRQFGRPSLLAFVVAKIREAFAALLSSPNEKKSPVQQVATTGKPAKKRQDSEAPDARLFGLLQCLEGRQDVEAADLLNELFAGRETLAKVKGRFDGQTLVDQLLLRMATGPASARRELIAAHATLSPDNLAYAFNAAREMLPPEEVYDTFSSYLKSVPPAKTQAKPKKDETAARHEVISKQLQAVAPWYLYEQIDWNVERPRAFDSRWLDIAVEQKDLDLTVNLMQSGHPAGEAYLAEVANDMMASPRTMNDAYRPLRIMISYQHPEAVDAFLRLLKLQATSTISSGSLYQAKSLIPQLPPEAAPRIEALLPSFSEKVADQLAGPLRELKMKAAAGAAS